MKKHLQKMTQMRYEYELYEPVKRLLVRQGFRVQGEVKSLDVMGVKGEETIGVELKLAVNLKLILQAVDRLKLVDAVYIALPQVSLKTQKSQYPLLIGLLRKLEIGLITVQGEQAVVVLEAKPFDAQLSRQRNRRRQASLIQEFLGRGDTEQRGGVQGVRMTAYRLRVMKIVEAMKTQPMWTSQQLKRVTGIEDTYSILHHNYYGWFIKVKRGHYALVDQKK